MRVIHLNSLLTGGGTDDQCVKLVQGLQKLGVDARIAGPDGREYSRIIRELKLPFHVTPPEGLFQMRLIFATAGIIRREKIEIIHGHHGRDIWPTLLAALLSGARPKIVLTRHMAKSPTSWPSRWFLLFLADTIIACSHFVAHVLKEGHYEPDSLVEERQSRPPLIGNHSKIQVIYGGIDTGRFKLMDSSKLRTQWGLKADDYVFAMVGAYELPVGKGQRKFLEAAAKIEIQLPNARFLIVGRGNMADVLHEDIQRLGLKGKAWLTPYCNNMPAAMNAIDCLVHSQIGTEAMPGVVCEAQACGKPVIASDLDGIPEALAITGKGSLVRPGSVDELAEAMLMWAGKATLTPTEQQQMHARVVDGFSLQNSARNYAGFYRTLLEKR